MASRRVYPVEPGVEVVVSVEVARVVLELSTVAGPGFGAINGGGSGTRLRPSFTAPRIAPQVIEGNFYNNIARQPSAQSLVGRYQVFVENKSATVVGTVNTRAEADRLIRQLRLQPGIYEIDNQLQVSVWFLVPI